MRLKRFWPGALLLFLLACPLTAAQAEWNAGGGMEYYSVKVLVNDRQGPYYHSILQTTMAMARLSYDQGPWWLGAGGGLSDWNVSGEWQGTRLDTVTVEPFFWAWQQQYHLAARYTVWDSFGLGLRYLDHRLRHYDGQSQYTFLHYHFQTYDVTLNYQPLQTGSVTIEMSAAYGFRADLEFFKSMYFAESDFLLCEYSGTGAGYRLQGQASLLYRDSAGWGLEVTYGWDRAWFSDVGELSRVMLTSGRLTGYFVFHF